MASRHHPAAATHESTADALERDAFNAAFRELGLRWHWDVATFHSLKSLRDDAARVEAYVATREPHLLKAYDAAFLIDAVLVAKQQSAVAVGRPAHGRATRVPDCADFATAQTGF